MSEWMSDREPNTEEEKPRFNRSKVVRIVISILVAIAMWLYVDLERAPERTMTIRDIPVEFSGENTTLADKNLMLLSGYDTTIDLTVGELYTKEVPVECHVVGEVAEGYFTGDVVLDPEVLTLRAQRDDLLNVSCAKLTVDISGATRSVVQTVDVQLYDYDGNPVENSNIRTNTSLIQAKVPVLTTREVELAVEFSGVPGAAMNSIKCDITPKTVRLNGEADVLDSIDKLVLATLHVDDLELHQQNSYVVTPPDGTWLVNGNEVATADITLEGIEEKSLTATSIEFDKLPSGLYAIAPDGGLTVRLWGLSEEIEAVTAENLRVIADMSAVTGQGTVTVPVTVTISGFNDVTVRGTYELTVTVTDVAPTVPETAEGAAASHPAA